MKKKYIINPYAAALLFMILFAGIIYCAKGCHDTLHELKQLDKESTNEMLEHHSSPDQLVVEYDGYIRIIKQ